MDIGTAKPDLAERDGVPHHLLDLWHVRQASSVAEYRGLARAEIDRLRAAGTIPLLVGGSGLYIRAVLDELEFPGTDAALRARLEEELAAVGPAVLHERLATLDPAAAAAVLPSNGRRIVRALEVIQLTGGPFRAQLPEPQPHYPAVVVGLDRDPVGLDERVAARVDRMWAAGFVEEVAALAADGLREGPTASRALGYAQVLAQFDGELSPDEARERTVSTTRRFVRRQRSWFRRDATVNWFDAGRPGLVDAVTAVITARTIER
jgi:tRNA dimethylallyltransferase